jgi:cytosine/uracil/thiamine/allantoin permease
LLFVTTSLLWMLAATMAGRYLVRVIVALMLVYPVVEALLIAAAALFAFRGLPSYRPEALGPLVPASVPVRVIIQIMFGFFATAGLTSADWGRTLESEKDVRMGGLVAVAFASWVVATLAVLTVAGSGFAASEVGGIRPPGSFRYVAAVEALFPGRVAGGILMTFGLAGLAPAVFASSVFGMRLHAIRPKLSRTKSAIVVTVVAWLLVVTGLGARIYSVIGVVGGLLTPAAGAIAADYVLSRGNWPGPRQGFNRPGVLAWFVGAIIGVLPTFLPLPRLQPASVVAFVAAFLVYWLATTRGLAAPFEPMPELEVATHE